MRALAVALTSLALALPAGAALPDANEGGNGGGYTYLPTCSTQYVGVTLYVQHHYWLCTLAGSRATPPYWTLIS